MARCRSAGNAGCSYNVFWKPVARWISAVSTAGNRWKSSSGNVEAPCWTAPASPDSRATSPRRPRTSKSSLTSATPPAGSGTPPCEVPVWTLTFDSPVAPAARWSSSRRYPSRYARSSPSVEFCFPTSPISPPTETVTPSVSSERIIEVPLGQIDEGRRINVDVAIARVDRQPARAPDLLGHGFRIRGVLLRVELVVVALDEDGCLPAGCDRAGQDCGRVVDRTLERIRLLASSELEDHGSDVASRGRLEGGPCHVEDLRA